MPNIIRYRAMTPVVERCMSDMVAKGKSEMRCMQMWVKVTIFERHSTASLPKLTCMQTTQSSRAPLTMSVAVGTTMPLVIKK